MLVLFYYKTSSTGAGRNGHAYPWLDVKGGYDRKPNQYLSIYLIIATPGISASDALQPSVIKEL